MGGLELIKKALYAAGPHTPDEAVVFATRLGRVEEWLKSSAADPNAEALLHHAVAIGLTCSCGEDTWKVVQLLLDAGADINLSREDKWHEVRTPLDVALEYDDAEDIVRRLLDAGASPHVQDGLHIAAARGDHAVLRALLDHGADPDATNSVGRTLLHDAARAKSVECTRLLLDRGANPAKQKEDPEDPEDTETPWDYCFARYGLERNDVDAVKLLAILRLLRPDVDDAVYEKARAKHAEHRARLPRGGGLMQLVAYGGAVRHRRCSNRRRG